MKRPIAISLSPNVQKNDIFSALKMLLMFWKFFQCDYIKQLERWFRSYFKVSYAISFASGRGALYTILKALDISKNDEVLMQAFTCVAVSGPILALKAKPVYVDINNSLTMDPVDLEKKITKKSKVIIVQHTFGIPADLDKIIKIAKEHNLTVVEDCAHLLGTIYKNKKIGLYGIASFFSFGRDKAFSSVFGGMVITNNKDLGTKIRIFQKRQNFPSFFWTFQQLLHPIAFSFILPTYNLLSIGKIILVVLQKIKLLSFPVIKEEKQGKLPLIFVKKLPNALCFLTINQLKKIEEYNLMRRKIASIYLQKIMKENVIFPYEKSLPFLRFPVIVNNRDKIFNSFKKKGIYIGKWYSEIIDPIGVNFEKINYKKGVCPKAEEIAGKIINLPTYPTMKTEDAEKIVQMFNKYATN